MTSSIKPLGYTTQLTYAMHAGHFCAGCTPIPRSPRVDGMAAFISQATVWNVPAAQLPLLIHTRFQSDDLKGATAPFENMTIEYEFDYEILGIEPPPNAIMASRRRVAHVFTNRDDGHVYIMGYASPDSGPSMNYWIQNPTTFKLAPHWGDDVSSWLKVDNDTQNVHIKGVDTANAPVEMACAANAYGVVDQRNPWLTKLQQDYTDLSTSLDEFLVVIGLIGVLSCNPVVKTVTPSKLRQARHRKKYGVPLPDLYYVDVAVNRVRYESAGEGTGAGGSRRTHWRRGHIRRLQSGKRTWVRPTLVNAAAANAGQQIYKVKP